MQTVCSCRSLCFTNSQLYYNKVKPFTYNNQSINNGTQVIVDIMNNSCFLSLWYRVDMPNWNIWRPPFVLFYSIFEKQIEIERLLVKGPFWNRKNTLWEAFLPSRMNQAWLHHTHAGYSVSQKVLNATEKCLREQLAKAQEQRESSAEHRRRVALCNCVKKLLLLLLLSSSRAELFLLLWATSTVWVLMRADPLPDHLKWIMMMIYPTIYLCYLHAFCWFLLLNHYSSKKPCVAMRTAGRQMMLLHDLEMRPKLW